MADTKNVYQRLSEAQAHIVAPRQKSRFNTGSRSAEQILEVAKPACRDNGLVLVTSEVAEQIGERMRIRAIATVFNLDNPEQYICSEASAWEGEISSGLDASQVSGKTGSYAKKYALQHLFAIDDTKDADFDDRKPATVATPAPIAVTANDQSYARRPGKPLEPAQSARIYALGRKLNINQEDLEARVQALKTKAEGDDAIAKLEDMVAERSL